MKPKLLKKPVNIHLVTLLESALEQVKSGNTQGIVMLLNQTGNDYSFASAGDMAFSEVMLAFEAWKFDQQMMQWKETNK